MADPTYPDDLLYHPEHAWARIEGDLATFGITWYGQDALGELVAFDLPTTGTRVVKDEFYAEAESAKAVSDVFAPLSGEVVEINPLVSERPDAANDDPYGEGWLVRVRLSHPVERAELLDVAAYMATLPAV
jgi:glycine cleavage system H protein